MKRLIALAAASTFVLTSCGMLGGQQANPTVSVPPTCSPAKSAPSGRTSESLTIDGEKRTYELSVPASYTGKEPVPVVFAFHGRGSTGTQQLLLSSMDQVGNQNGFIVVAPTAIDGQWQFPLIPAQTTADTEFLTQLSSALESRFCVDKSRVYASGMSLGSAMTFVLACSPDRKFAAFGGVGASFYRPQCDKSPPAPLIYFHGTEDAIVPFEGGQVEGSPRSGPTSRVQPAMENMAAWAKHNGCQETPTEKTTGDTTLIAWQQCKDNAVVDFYRVNGGGHTWPGTNETIAMFLEGRLGKTSQAVNASELMWDFFKQYQLPTS